ncbi:hypothetical protein WDU94_001522 [Cyamophila willieti]
MNRVILFLLFYLMLIVFSSATYDINDITGNYPYCLTASKDNKPPTSNDKSEILKKSFPFTYLEIMGNTPHDSINVDSEVKANQWSTRNEAQVGLVDKDNELASDNDYSNTIGYSLEKTHNFNKDIGTNDFVTSNPLQASINDMEVSHNFGTNNDFEPNNNNFDRRNLRTNNNFKLNNMERTNDFRTNNDLELINKIETNNEQNLQPHDSHPSIQYGEETESSGHTHGEVNGINRKSVRMNTNIIQAHHKMIDKMLSDNIQSYNTLSNSLPRSGENLESDIRTDNVKSDKFFDNVRGRNVQSEKMLRDANIPNVYYQPHTVRTSNDQSGKAQNENIHSNKIHSNDIRSDNMLSDNVDDNMLDNVRSGIMLNENIDDMQANMLSPSGDLLLSNDVAQALQGKTNSLTDEFIGVDERQALVNNEHTEEHNAKLNDGNIGKEKGTLKVSANGKKKVEKNLLKKKVVIEVEKEVDDKESNNKENARVKGLRKLTDGRSHKKMDGKPPGKGNPKKVKILKHLSPPISCSKLRRQGKSKSLRVDILNSATYNNMTRSEASKVENLHSQHPGDLINLKCDPPKALSAESLNELLLRANPKKRSAENQSDVSDKIYRIYQDMTDLNNRAKLKANSRIIVDHNVCVDDQKGTSESPTSDTRRKRMLLGRKKKRKKHSRSENETNQQLEKSDNKEEQKKHKMSTKKRKFLRKKHKLRINPKTVKDSNLNLVNSNYDSARYRRGAKSSCLFDMFSLPFEKYLQDPDQNKKDRGVKKTLKTNQERRVDFTVNDVEGSSDLFKTLKPDLQENKNPLPSDILGFINCRNANKRNSKKKQVISLNTHRINQNTKCVSNDLIAASNFMSMFSGNMSAAALKSFLSSIDNSTTHSSTVHSHSEQSDVAHRVKPKDHISQIHCLNRDGGLAPVPKLDPIYDLPNSLKNMYLVSDMVTNSKEDILLGWNLPKIVTKANHRSEPDPCESMIQINKAVSTTAGTAIAAKPLITSTFATLAPPVHFVTSAKTPFSTPQNKILTTNPVVTNTKHPLDEYLKKSAGGGNKETTTPQRGNTTNLDVLCATYQGGNKPTTTTCMSPEVSSKSSENVGKTETTTCSIATYSTAAWVTGPNSISPAKPNNGSSTTCMTTTCMTTTCIDNSTKKTTASAGQNSTKITTASAGQNSTKLTTASAGQNSTKVTTAKIPDNCTTTPHNDCPAADIKDTRSTTCITQFSLQNEKLTGNKLDGNANKVKRQALPLNLFPMLLQKDIEQPVQEGQSKKIFLYLYQGNPNEMSVNTKEEGSELERFAHPHGELTRESNLIKKFFSPNTFDIRFSGKNSSPIDKELSETKKTKEKEVTSTEKCDSKGGSKKSSTTTTSKNSKQISTTCKPSTTTCKTSKTTTTCKTSTQP